MWHSGGEQDGLLEAVFVCERAHARACTRERERKKVLVEKSRCCGVARAVAL